MNPLLLKTIAHIKSDFPEKFGIPRQGGLVESLKSKIIFTPKYRVPEAFYELEGYSHLWLIWGFSESVREDWSPTVRPPRLGGNKRVGVFATRSPFRPNPIGLSCVQLDKLELSSACGPVLHVSGADLLDGTPIYDIKPYLAYVDSYPTALEGFAGTQKDYHLTVECPQELLFQVPMMHRDTLLELLAQDPRPSYQADSTRIYGMKYAGLEVKFQVNKLTLRVCSIERYSPEMNEMTFLK